MTVPKGREPHASAAGSAFYARGAAICASTNVIGSLDDVGPHNQTQGETK